MRHDAWAGALLWCSCQSPVAHSCCLLNHLNSFCGGMFKLNAKFGAESLLYSLSHFECDGHTVHTLTQWHLLSHWLVQWSRHCSCMHIPVHSPWLPGYIDVVQTVILTVAGLFPDRSCMLKDKRHGKNCAGEGLVRNFGQVDFNFKYDGKGWPHREGGTWVEAANMQCLDIRELRKRVPGVVWQIGSRRGEGQDVKQVREDLRRHCKDFSEKENPSKALTQKALYELFILAFVFCVENRQ